MSDVLPYTLKSYGILPYSNSKRTHQRHKKIKLKKENKKRVEIKGRGKKPNTNGCSKNGEWVTDPRDS